VLRVDKNDAEVWLLVKVEWNFDLELELFSPCLAWGYIRDSHTIIFTDILMCSERISSFEPSKQGSFAAGRQPYDNSMKG
jgi:hypothetical protein